MNREKAGTAEIRPRCPLSCSGRMSRWESGSSSPRPRVATSPPEGASPPGGRFATPDLARAWATQQVHLRVTVGEVVDETPEDAEALGKYQAARVVHEDYREWLATHPIEVEDPDELLDIDQAAAHWAITRESVETGVAHGTKPPPDEGSGRLGKWKRITVAQWDAEAPLRRAWDT
jgi:hypothetical protein